MMDRRTDDVQATGSLPPRTDAARAGVGDARRARPPGSRRPARGLDRARAAISPTRTTARNASSRSPREWTRIGRSLAADVRFDDATVSRRHALIVCQADGVRVLDDRSLNGVYVNGERVEWSPLSDGDQIAVGRHTLCFLDTSAVGAGASAGRPPAPPSRPLG